MQTKHCKRCDRDLPLSMFHKNKKTKDDLAFYCKECVAKYGRKYRDTGKGIYNNIKNRNKYYKTHNFSISFKDFKEWYENESKICAYCDIPEDFINIINDTYNRKCIRLTVDCIENDLGYIKGNLALSCLRCNFTKSNLLSFDEMRELAQKYFKPKWMFIYNSRE